MPAPAQRVTAVAVLPFQDLASSPDSSYLGDGMTEGLIADLAQIGSLKVISRSSGAMAQGTARSLAELARELGVQAVVKGSIRRAGDTVRVNVRFLHAPDSTLLFTGDYQGRLGELPDLQREITIAITGSISAKLKGAERSRLDARREVDQRAYEAYLRGRFYLERGELEQARAQFEQAGRIAPDWAPPYVGLANYYTSLPFFTDVPPAEVLPKARAALAQALELDETLAEAHAANAYIRAYYEWDWRAAEREFRRALELRPNYADAYFSYSRFLASRRRLDEAIAQLGRAVELDPLSLPLQANRALLDYFAGRYDEADSRLREVLKSDSTDVTGQVGTGAGGRTAGATRRGDRDPGADQRQQPQPQVVARPRLRGRRARPPRRGASSPSFAAAATRSYVPVLLVRAGARRPRRARSGAPLSRARVRGALDRAGLPADRSAARAAPGRPPISRPGTTARRGVSAGTVGGGWKEEDPRKHQRVFRSCSPAKALANDRPLTPPDPSTCRPSLPHAGEATPGRGAGGCARG